MASLLFLLITLWFPVKAQPLSIRFNQHKPGRGLFLWPKVIGIIMHINRDKIKAIQISL